MEPYGGCRRQVEREWEGGDRPVAGDIGFAAWGTTSAWGCPQMCRSIYMSRSKLYLSFSSFAFLSVLIIIL